MDPVVNIHIPKEENSSIAGRVLLGLTGGAAVLLTVACLPFVSPAFRRICLPYVPATSSQISNILKALSGRSGKLVDVGSGDGRVVFAAARAGFIADGVELNPWLVLYSKIEAYRRGLSHSTSFHCKDLWRFDFHPYPNVIIFGVQEMMQELEAKLASELNCDACVVACRFPFPSWIPEKTVGSGIDTVWLYRPKKQQAPNYIQHLRQDAKLEVGKC